jgi:phage terminase large subunit GpA-like protein
LISSGQLLGRTDADEVWDDLQDLLLTPIAGLGISRALIDSGFRPGKPDSGDEHKVYEFARRMPRLVWATKGHAAQRTPIAPSKIDVTGRATKAPYSLTLLHLDSDFFKSLVHSRLRALPEQPNYFAVPEDVTEDYCRQIVSEVRVIGRADGKPRWIVRNRQNHLLDAEALAAAAAYMLRVNQIPDGTRRGKSPDDPDPDPPPAPEPPSDDDGGGSAPPAPRRESQSQSSIRDRFSRMSSRLNR